jgi:hypothetical protein
VAPGYYVTTEPIATEQQVAAVVDAYRQRWLIEEFFKALKTGCQYQQLQLESLRGAAHCAVHRVCHRVEATAGKVVRTTCTQR